ncbi:MAG: hypothetical protein ILO43_05250 [Clostridia bacterium]|nr:hypothetical protein [Clostridia bacterium]MBP5272353.1 hypothetical protein [Clostridia bacterium]MBP5458813.1 hypothetical protein [Clostridia bacterium]
MFMNEAPGAGLLRYALLPGEPVDRFSLAVLTQNPPEGVFRLGRETTEEYDHLLAAVAGYAPVGNIDIIVKQNITFEKVLEAVQTVRDGLHGCMIPEDQLVLRPEWTFLSEADGSVGLLVLPTPLARDLSLTFEDYACLLRRRFPEEEEREALREALSEKESAKPSASTSPAAKPLRLRLREFWENLD